MSNVLLKNGFKCTKIIHNYWKADSLKNKYSYPLCGQPHCICPTEVYIKKSIREI